MQTANRLLSTSTPSWDEKTAGSAFAPLGLDRSSSSIVTGGTAAVLDALGAETAHYFQEQDETDTSDVGMRMELTDVQWFELINVEGEGAGNGDTKVDFKNNLDTELSFESIFPERSITFTADLDADLDAIYQHI